MINVDDFFHVCTEHFVLLFTLLTSIVIMSFKKIKTIFNTVNKR